MSGGAAAASARKAAAASEVAAGHRDGDGRGGEGGGPGGGGGEGRGDARLAGEAWWRTEVLPVVQVVVGLCKDGERSVTGR